VPLAEIRKKAFKAININGYFQHFEKEANSIC
jgi:hypothetical protein